MTLGFHEDGQVLSTIICKHSLAFSGSSNNGLCAEFSKVRAAMPQIMAMYDKNGWEMALFYLDDGHAEIRGMMELKEEFDV